MIELILDRALIRVFFGILTDVSELFDLDSLVEAWHVKRDITVDIVCGFSSGSMIGLNPFLSD